MVLTLEAVGSIEARWLSIARSVLIPSVLARIFIPLSLVVTANNEPSLLNRSRGLA